MTTWMMAKCLICATIFASSIIWYRSTERRLDSLTAEQRAEIEWRSFGIVCFFAFSMAMLAIVGTFIYVLVWGLHPDLTVDLPLARDLAVAALVAWIIVAIKACYARLLIGIQVTWWAISLSFLDHPSFKSLFVELIDVVSDSFPDPVRFLYVAILVGSIIVKALQTSLREAVIEAVSPG